MNKRLEDYINGEYKNCWFGEKPPFNMMSLDITACTNYRVSSNLHHNFDVVWLYEECLDKYGALSWKIVLDEAIRLLMSKGTIIVKARKYGSVTPIEIKNFLGRHIGINVYLQYEDKEEDDFTNLVFQVERLNFEKYCNDEWTFAVLTTGKKVDNVVSFLTSIRKFENKHSEIIIAGPYDVAYDQFDVRYLDCSVFRDELAEISRKKNCIVDMATKPNLMIVHDRYELSKDFFVGFEDYGYDYDYLSVVQITDKGEKFPSIAVYLGDNGHGGQVIPTNLEKLCKGTYVNGGLLVFKTHTIKRIRFNDLLCWEQREDVELCKRFVNSGIVPRMNYLSSTKVLEMREGYFFAFLKEEELSDDMRDALFFSAMEKNIQKKWDEFISVLDKNQVYIFGAGVVTKKIIELCKDYQKKNIRAILVTDTTNNPNNIEGIPVVNRMECLNDDNKIIIGLLYSKQNGIRSDLMNIGIDEIRLVGLDKETNNALYYLYSKKINEGINSERQ